MPSQAELDEMFPEGWRAKSPSWQAQFEQSEWLKDQNARKQYGYSSKRRGWGGGAGYGGEHWTAGPGWFSKAVRHTPKTVSNIASSFLRFPRPLLWFSILSGIPIAALQGKDYGRALRSKKDVTKEEKASLETPVHRGSRIGWGIGGLLGASAPILANAPIVGEHGLSGLHSVWRNMGHSPAFQYVIPAVTGMALGADIGTLVGTGIMRSRLPDIKAKMEERKKERKLNLASPPVERIEELKAASLSVMPPKKKGLLAAPPQLTPRPIPNRTVDI
jgi:hypothetical protein